MAHWPTPNHALAALCEELMDETYARTATSRLGEETRELNYPIQFRIDNPLQREIYLPGRAASLPAQIVETMWVLSGRRDIETLLPYLPRAAEFSDDGKTWRGAYGPRIRFWASNPNTDDEGTDQLAHVVKLLKADPSTRRAVISLYNAAIDSEDGKDIPCNNWLHFLSRDGVLDLNVAIRSNDVIWGWSGINQFEWSVLLELVASLTNLRVGTITYNTTSLHVYDRHYAKATELAKLAVQPYGESYAHPTFPGASPRIVTKTLPRWDNLVEAFFRIEKAIRTQAAKGALTADTTTRIDGFEDLMIRGWLQVIAYHWTRDAKWLTPLSGTALEAAALASPTPAGTTPPKADLFFDYVNDLHAKKHAAYGDSWKKRGENVGIMANIARKVDRLGVTDDLETSADTAIDLMVYLAKYHGWLEDRLESFMVTVPRDEPAGVAKILAGVVPVREVEDAEPRLRRLFDAKLMEYADQHDRNNALEQVKVMLRVAVPYARSLWKQSIGDTYQGADVD